MTDLRAVARTVARLDFIDGLGVAIGDSSVAMAHLRKRFARVTLNDTRVVALPPVAEVDARRRALVDALAAFGRSHAGAAERVAVSLPRGAAMAARLSLPAAAKGDLHGVVDFEVARLFPVPVEEIGWDMLVHAAAERIDVDVFALRRSVLADTLALLGEAGLRPHMLTLRPLALLDLVGFLEEPAPITFLVRDGGNLEVDVMAASRLRRSHALGAASEMPGPLLGAVAGELGLAREALPVIDFGTLDGAGLPGEGAAQDAGRDLLGRLGERLGRPALVTEVTAAVLPAIGTALSAVREGTTDFDLLPEEDRRSLEEGAPLLTFFLASVLVLITAVWLVAGVVRDLSIRSDLAAALEEIDPQVRQVHRDETDIAERERRLAIMDGSADRRVAAYLVELTEIVPKDAYLTAFRLREGQLELEGFAKSASDLIPLIEKSPNFGNPQFTSPVTKVQDNQERFALSVELPK